jgi:4-amino-4-deoxy-L-arabinose transferase-like glycosyltransferase
MPPTRTRSSAYLIPLVCILLLGAVLQFEGLGRMTQMLNYDEAYYSVDALSLLNSPRFEAFFPANQGRESGWMYVLAVAYAVFGIQPLVSRIIAMMISFLALAAVYRLGRETIGQRAAMWSVAGLAVLYWHAQIGHLALRINLFPLVGTIAFAVLFHAYRRNKLGSWVLAGVLFGLLVYTYFSARLWIAYGFLMQGWWLLREKEKRRGVLLSLLLATLLAVPIDLVHGSPSPRGPAPDFWGCHPEYREYFPKLASMGASLALPG